MAANLHDNFWKLRLFLGDEGSFFRLWEKDPQKVCGLDESKKNIQWLVSNSWGLCLFGCEFMSQHETWYKYSPSTYLTHFPVVKVMGGHEKDYFKKNEIGLSHDE